MTKKSKWDNMSPDEREKAVRELMAAGGSNKSAADDLGTTSGTIAGFRRRKHIASTHDAPSMGKKRKPAQKKAALHKPSVPAPASAKPKAAPPTAKPAPHPDVPGLIISRSEASRCEYKKERCEYEAKPGTNFCPLHQQDPARH